MNETVDVGDVVVYQGSIRQYHGEKYNVSYIPADPNGRGYTLLHMTFTEGWGAVLSNVHRDSFVKVTDETESSD